MARKLKAMTKVDANFARTGPNHNTILQAVSAPAAAVFGCLADGPAWSEWLGIDVEWTSPEPHGVGTTRTVRTNGQRIDETFLMWEDGIAFNFRFDASTMPVSAFAEEYRVTPTSDDACELRWDYAFEWRGPLATLASRIFAFGFGIKAKRSFKKLAQLVESDPQRFLD